MVSIRQANIEDIPWLISELKEFAKFYPSRISIFPDDEKASEILEMMIEHHVFYLSEIDGEKTGFIAGYRTPHSLNPFIKVLAEAFWWVSPIYRGTKSGQKLLEKFIEYGRLNFDWITFALEENSPVSERTLTKRGFVPFEKNYIMEVI